MLYEPSVSNDTRRYCDNIPLDTVITSFKMAGNILQDQVYLVDTTYDPHPDEAMTLNSATNTTANEPFTTIPNPIWQQPIAWNASFDGRMTLNRMDDTITNHTSGTMTLNAMESDTFHVNTQVFPGYTASNSYVDRPLAVNWPTHIIEDGIPSNDNMTCDSYVGG